MRTNLALISGTAIVFAVAVFVMLHLMPPPLDSMSYLVIGSVATLAAMLALFLTLVLTRLKSRDTFFKRRPKR